MCLGEGHMGIITAASPGRASVESLLSYCNSLLELSHKDCV